MHNWLLSITRRLVLCVMVLAQVRINQRPYGNPYELRQNPAGRAAVPGSGPLGATDLGMTTESCGPSMLDDQVSGGRSVFVRNATV